MWLKERDDGTMMREAPRRAVGFDVCNDARAVCGVFKS